MKSVFLIRHAYINFPIPRTRLPRRYTSFPSQAALTPTIVTMMTICKTAIALGLESGWSLRLLRSWADPSRYKPVIC